MLTQMNGPIRSLRWLAGSAIVIYLVVAVPTAILQTVLRLRSVVLTAGLSEASIRPRVFGRAYVDAIEHIRVTIPENEPYLIAEQREFSMGFVRFDLLPRRAIEVRQDTQRPQDCLEAQVRWMVVANGIGRPPLLLERPVRVPSGCPPAPWSRFSP